ncbi:hypothetical protein CO101_02855 [Candidatus Berkelbacteria bacterium CG_4_9_14_3_um_filter_39_23]|uniref:Uncharacterized protein n=2 Tax=Candidatus Berkelbacteria TaxID=1618330 RepID=A0A2M7CIN3_9BACT|nr:MAG: hypothetical protein AUK14_01145 [Candidatus Berkelbacteria bacterium CG2_30_39_44]PIR27800.1 MAG: hypothetical protein COV39_02580 [Candidatus Berkelbacteria bacterium CG11_big_fil_rev_8_21_14_0_20_40_23]PIV25495.1 MAG: hypothetical protein COS38_01320 [Candidatus Berkelbacteria bacterium CG03_land_8_20_14_0_80_40_36]PIX30852.1 MAG: hypothetical protein COZ62_00445 [Candidatus Berkelbacteria bacterium CG_4_8_14_3_um_filter_39_27]PIZ28556.1 MAG: hypothetical protein COY44_03545 [Candida
MKYLIAVAGLGVVLFFFKGLFFCLEQAVWAGDVPAQIRLGVEFIGAVALCALVVCGQLEHWCPRQR